MGALLGKTKNRVTRAPVQEVITRLKTQREMLNIHRQQTELNLESDRYQAKQKLREGKREEAKTLIKKKMYYERELQRSNVRLDQIDQITNDLELAGLALELTNFGKSKVKRGRWKSIIKRKHTRQQNHDSRKKLRKSVQEDVEIQVPSVFNQKERDKINKILKETRKCIVKQETIEELISEQLLKGDDTAVEKELEAIMNGCYPLPDMDQEKNTYKEGLKKPQGSEDVTAISA